MKKKIIFIEDNQDTLDSVKYTLEAENFDFYGATSGTQGIAMLTKFRIDLLLLDIGMPNMNGFEVCRAIKSQPSINLPVIFISAHSDAASIARAFSLGADDYIIKPFEPSDLVTRVKRVLEKYDRS
ncbi:MAG: response regulator transcription factor [candidate division FCPU426 bacterium]